MDAGPNFVDIGGLSVSILSLVLSGWAVRVANGNQAKLVCREEFADFRERLTASRLELSAVRRDLERLADGTVPLEAVVAGFDREYAKVDAALRNIDAICAEIDEVDLFGGGWQAAPAEAVVAWATEFDVVANAHRPDAARQEAATRAAAALVSIEETLRTRVLEVVKNHAS